MNARFAAIVTLGSAIALAADMPYAGKWKLNFAKSDFGQSTVTYEQLSGGEMKMTADGQSFTFKADGHDYPTPWGNTAAFKSLGADSWEETDKANGKLTGTSMIKLSADGKSLTVTSKVMQADGGSHEDSAVYERVSGGTGLAGKWKTKNLKSTGPTVMEIAAGSDGLKLMSVNEGGVCDAKFDGKDYPSTGAMWPAGWTCMIAKSGARGFDLTYKKDGKTMYKSTVTASSDGKTLMETGGAPGTNEKFKAVYDRQ
jgi:hypothetical protein